MIKHTQDTPDIPQQSREGDDVAPWTMRQTWLGVCLTMLPWMALALALNSQGNAASSNTPLPFNVDLTSAIVTVIFAAIIEGAFLIAPYFVARSIFSSRPAHARLIFGSLGFHPASIRRASFYIIGCMLLIFAANLLYSFILTSFHINLQTNDQVILARSAQAPLTTYATLFAAVFIAPFCEEIFFRGFVFPGLRRGMPLVAAIVASALLFAIAHVDPGSFAVLFTIGLALAVVRWRTRSIWPGMILHMLNNGIGAVSILLAMWGLIK